MNDIPIERIVALNLHPDDLIVIETGPAPLSMAQVDAIRRQWKASGISNRVVVMQGGMKFQVSLRDSAFVYDPS